MGCSESTHYKSSIQLSQQSTLDTCQNSPVKACKKEEEIEGENFENFDTYEQPDDLNCFHIYDSTIQRIVVVPQLKSIDQSSIFRRRRKQK